jgi:CBS domain-containing protein
MTPTVDLLMAQVKDVMTTDVFCLRPDSLLKKAGEIFNTKNIHHIPIVDQKGKLKGIMSRHDYNLVLNSFTKFDTQRSRKKNELLANTILLSEIMTEKVVTLNEDDSLIKAANILKENMFHAIPILNKEQKLTGILTSFDLLVFAFPES